MDPIQARIHIEKELAGPKARRFMDLVMNRIRNETVKNLTGRILKVQTGRLRASVTTNSDVREKSILGTIGTNVFYARIWEITGAKAHWVRPRKAQALAIHLGRQIIFRKSAYIPQQGPRPFMWPAIVASEGYIRDLHERRFKEALDVTIDLVPKGGGH